MHKKFEINQTKIKGSCQLGRKVVIHNSKSDLPLLDLEHMQKKFEIKLIKIKGGCQLGRKVLTHNSKSDLPLSFSKITHSMYRYFGKFSRKRN